ncbi:MAG TPA: M48 family metallopeptidase [Burkholderiales bacterium]|nr:M48 family metallopeptidase [Burkholderiales bacterium]
MGRARLAVAAIIALFAIITYFGSTSENPLTGEKQRVAMTPEQEIALGYQSAPQMAAQMGGVSRNAQAVALVQRVGEGLVRQSVAAKSPYKFSFHVLADPKTVNAFALPGGPVFITEGLLRLLKTEAELAGVLGHEIGHVIARHSSEHLAKQQLTQGLLGALVVGSGDYTTAQIGQVVGNMINMSYGRDDELESDALGIRIMAEAGYDPRGMLRVMEVLAKASGGSRQPEFFSTHPAPENRAERIKQAIARQYPDGVPENLRK